MSYSKWMGSQKSDNNHAATDANQNQEQERPISSSLRETTDSIRKLLGDNDDFNTHEFHVFGQFQAMMYYFTDMTDHTIINNTILKPLKYGPRHIDVEDIPISQLKDTLINDTLYHSEGYAESSLSIITDSILRGQTVIAIEGLPEAFIFDTRKISHRSIEQPATEQVIRGSREGFIESLSTNISLLRYRMQTTDFRVKSMEIGARTKSKVAICFMEGVTNPGIVEEVKKRLSAIEIDAILDSGYLEQFIEDNHWSPFPQIQYTERPDKVVANILEGRVAILVDGSPLALIVPTVFSQFYQTAEDYTERFLLMSGIRLSRLVALVFSLVFPSLYVAIISFNPELIPTEFAVAVAGGRAGVPFPAVVEVLVIEISMEVLREATIRLPQQVGGALSIVGVLVIGQAAVAAGFASPITVVIIALTTIGSFATPAYNAALALRILRFPLIILAGTFGLYGVMVGLILVTNHLLSLRSFGVPYLSPFVPGNFQGMRDLLTRAPLWKMRNRPSFLYTLDQSRLGDTKKDQVNHASEDIISPVQPDGEKGQ